MQRWREAAGSRLRCHPSPPAFLTACNPPPHPQIPCDPKLLLPPYSKDDIAAFKLTELEKDLKKVSWLAGWVSAACVLGWACPLYPTEMTLAQLPSNPLITHTPSPHRNATMHLLNATMLADSLQDLLFEADLGIPIHAWNIEQYSYSAEAVPPPPLHPDDLTLVAVRPRQQAAGSSMHVRCWLLAAGYNCWRARQASRQELRC